MLEATNNKDRRKFVCEQPVAEYDGQVTPSESDFFVALFQNISQSGACFLSPHKPRTEKLMMFLGAERKLLVAKVVRIANKAGHPGYLYEVGCKFEKTLS